MPKLNGIKETALTVSDVERSERFYREVFDLRVIAGEPHRFRAFSVADSHVLLLFAAGQTNEPLELPGGVIPPHGASGRMHFAFSIDAADFDSWKQRLEKLGIPIESTITWPLGGRSLYLRDPDQHLVELVTPGIWSIY